MDEQIENRDRASLYAELQQVIGRCVGSEAAAGWRPTEDIQAQSLVHLDRVEVDSGGWPLYAPDARLTARSITLSFERSSLPAL